MIETFVTTNTNEPARELIPIAEFCHILASYAEFLRAGESEMGYKWLTNDMGLSQSQVEVVQSLTDNYIVLRDSPLTRLRTRDLP